MISLKKIGRVYPLKGGPFYALRNISLEIREGDFVSIMGPSGSGKSTLLHVLGLHDSAWTGEYWLQGEPVHQLDKKKRLELQKKHIGFVFQSYHLLDDLTVYENLEIPLSYRNVPKKERESIVCDTLDRFHLVIDVIDRVPGLGYRAAHVRQLMRDKLAQHHDYIVRTGEDLPEVRDWMWQSRRGS